MILPARLKLMATRKSKVLFFLMVGILATALCFLTFYKLGLAELNEYDECRHGVNAYEMSRTGNFIVTTYEYATDYWNLKPPLSEWLITISFRLFGYHVFSLRLYSAVSFLITAAVCFFFSWKRQGILPAIFTLAAFCALKSFYHLHSCRTADADAAMIMFYTVAVLCMCSEQINWKRVYLACLCFAGAFLLKGWHAAIIGILVLVVLGLHRFKGMTWKNFLLCGICAAGPVLLWAALRYQQDGTEFIELMFTHDVVERSTTVLETNSGDALFYINSYFRENGLTAWFLVFCAVGALVVALLPKNRGGKKWIICDELILILAIVIPFVLFSCAATKLNWYVYPTFPLIILLAAALVKHTTSSKKGAIATVLASVVLLGVGAFQNAEFVWYYPIYVDAYGAAIEQAQAVGENLSGCMAYRLDETGSPGWTQVGVMAAELYGDLHTSNGGVEAFLADNNSYLFVTGDIPEELSGYSVVGCYDNLTVLGHGNSASVQ